MPARDDRTEERVFVLLVPFAAYGKVWPQLPGAREGIAQVARAGGIHRIGEPIRVLVSSVEVESQILAPREFRFRHDAADDRHDVTPEIGAVVAFGVNLSVAAVEIAVRAAQELAYARAKLLDSLHAYRPSTRIVAPHLEPCVRHHDKLVAKAFPQNAAQFLERPQLLGAYWRIGRKDHLAVHAERARRGQRLFGMVDPGLHADVLRRLRAAIEVVRQFPQHGQRSVCTLAAGRNGPPARLRRHGGKAVHEPQPHHLHRLYPFLLAESPVHRRWLRTEAEVGVKGPLIPPVQIGIVQGVLQLGAREEVNVVRVRTPRLARLGQRRQ